MIVRGVRNSNMGLFDTEKQTAMRQRGSSTQLCTSFHRVCICVYERVCVLFARVGTGRGWRERNVNTIGKRTRFRGRDWWGPRWRGGADNRVEKIKNK